MTQATLPNLETHEFAGKLRAQTIACRLHIGKLGVRRALSHDQVRTAASQFAADAKSISASKRLVDTKHPAMREVTAVLSNAKKYWHSLTVPYPDNGVRLLRRDRLEDFNAQMGRYRDSLNDHAAKLQECYEELKQSARHQLGTLFNGGDYPDRLDTEFELAWDFPNIEPPAYLRTVHPALYEAEKNRINARFEEAVALTEQAFVKQFHEMLGRLSDRLRGGTDGKRKVFRDSSVENLHAFFDTFSEMSVGSSRELEGLVNQARLILDNKSAADLRGDQVLAESIGARLAEIENSLNTMVVDRPTRAFDLEDE